MLSWSSRSGSVSDSSRQHVPSQSVCVRACVCVCLFLCVLVSFVLWQVFFVCSLSTWQPICLSDGICSANELKRRDTHECRVSTGVRCVAATTPHSRRQGYALIGSESASCLAPVNTNCDLPNVEVLLAHPTKLHGMGGTNNTQNNVPTP